MEFKLIRTIAANIGAETPLLATAAELKAYVPDDIMAEIMGYHGIDLPRFEVSLLDAKHGYIKYIFDRDISDHIKHVFENTRGRICYGMMIEYKYVLSRETVALLPQWETGWLFAAYLTSSETDEMSMRNAYTLVASMTNPVTLFEYMAIGDSMIDRLTALVAWSSKFRDTIPAAIQTYIDVLNDDDGDDGGDDGGDDSGDDGEFDDGGE